MHQLNLLSFQKWPQLSSERHEILVNKQVVPEFAAFSIAAEPPNMDQLMQWTGVRNEIADEEFGMTPRLECRPPFVGIQLENFAHLTDRHVVGSSFVKFQVAHELTLLARFEVCFEAVQ